MLTENHFLARIDPFDASGLSNFNVPDRLKSAAKRLPGILQTPIKNRGHVQFSSPIGRLSEVIDASQEINLHILGFGNLAERFSLDGLRSLMRKNPELKIKVTAGDVYGEDDIHKEGTTKKDWLHMLRQQSGIDFTYLRRGEFEKKLESEQPDILMIATPPTRHADDLECVMQILGKNTETIIGVEKPFMHLETRAQVQKILAEDTAQRIHDIDFFNQGKAFLWLMTSDQGKGILGRFGRPAIINGNCIETVSEWRDWMFNQSISGGGTFVDCGSHNVNMMYVFMYHVFSDLGLGTDFDDPKIINSLFGRYHNNNTLRETYSLLQIKWKDVIWHIQNGKALPKTAYNLETMNENEDYLAVSVGTEDHPPFVLFVPDGSSPELYTLDGPGVGYEQIFERLIVMSMNPDKKVFPDPKASQHASFEVLLGLEDQVRKLQTNTKWIQYNTDAPIEGRPWPHRSIHLPVTDDAFGNIKPLQ